MITNATYTSPEWDHYVYPLSISPIPQPMIPGMIVLCIVSAISCVSTVALLGFLLYRFISTRNSYRAPLYKNQYMLLIFQLVLADFQCDLGFFLDSMWLHQNQIIAPSAGCIVQGWLVNIGDLASCFFVFAIACHTFATVVYGRRVELRTVCISIVACWTLALITTAVPVILHPSDIFVLQGNWCSINSKYDKLRLWFHYIWVLGGEGIVIIMYGITFVVLRKRLSSIKPALNQQQSTGTGKNANAKNNNAKTKQVTRATMYMIIYPVIYVLTTLPLAAGRISSMVGHTPPKAYLVTGGILMSCGGFCNCILYSVTRRIFLSSSSPMNTNVDARRSRYGKGTVNGVIELTQKGTTPGKYGELPSPTASTDNIVHMGHDTVSSLESKQGVVMETTWEVKTEEIKPSPMASPETKDTGMGSRTFVH